jgi:AcrR family transcriptional regulator
MRRTKEEAEKTREDILNAAVRLFSEKGVAHTSLQEIAVAANVTRGAVYWHFANKTEIFDALHARLCQPLTEMILQDVEKDHPFPLEQMEELCVKLLLDLEGNAEKRQAVTLFISQRDYVGDLAPYKAKHNARKAESKQLFVLYFEKAIKNGRLSTEADAQTLAVALGCYVKGVIIEYINDPDGFDIKKYAPCLMRHFFKSL